MDINEHQKGLDNNMAIYGLQTNSEEDNQGLLRRCRSNDPEACTELFSRYNRRIFNTAYRILGEEASAEDALQETLLNVYRGLSNFRGDSKISTWISRITINVCLGMLRKNKNKPTVELEENSAQELPAEINQYIDPLEHASGAELRSLVAEAFRRMSVKQRIVVRLHDLEENTIQEIARIIKCPVGTVKSRLFYGRQEFKDIFSSLLNSGFRKAVLN
jgi:RNA polymerase sigma-70 factor, ECF subfamily